MTARVSYAWGYVVVIVAAVVLGFFLGQILGAELHHWLRGAVAR